MRDLSPVALAMAVIVTLALLGWVASVVRRDVSLVDSLWSLFFLGAALAYAARAGLLGNPRAMLVLALVAAWALRLSVHLTVRNHGEPEDRRYAAMRAKRGPSFAWRSLYIVFLLQAALAAIIAAPLLAGIAGTSPLGPLDLLGASLWVTGFAFEAIGDWQLARFKASPANAARVLARGLWRYTRHPNYFGERECRINPRSSATLVRITVPRSITEAICSRPSENCTPSMAVGMLGKVESTRCGSMPLSNRA
jgi:steroid 5-alpha reductase family enzyme